MIGRALANIRIMKKVFELMIRIKAKVPVIRILLHRLFLVTQPQCFGSGLLDSIVRDSFMQLPRRIFRTSSSNPQATNLSTQDCKGLSRNAGLSIL
jgi:hypothetical protein